MRISGRMPTELRKISVELNPLRHAEGSAVIRWGDTWVMCAATVEERVPAWLGDKGQGWVTAEYALLPRSTSTRVSRTQGSRGAEIQRLVGRALRGIVDLPKLGRRTITVDCDVLQADGGTRVASITGGYCALAMALHYLWQEGKLPEKPLRDLVAGISLGIVDGMVMVDLEAAEDTRAEMDLNVVATGAGRLVEVQGTAEGKPLTRLEFDGLLDAGLTAAADVIACQQQALGAFLPDALLPR
jgi:ribonuclease PH